MSEQNLGYSNPDEIFYSDSTIKQKLTYLHGLRHTLEDDVDELWEYEDQWLKSIADLKMKKIDVKTDLEFLVEDMNTVNNEGLKLQDKAKLIQKKIKDEYGPKPITKSKHFKLIVMALLVIFILCLFNFYFFIAFLVVSCGYFLYVTKTYIADKNEQKVKQRNKALLDEQLNLVKKQLDEKIVVLNRYKEQKQDIEEQIERLTKQHEDIQFKLSSYKVKRNDLEKTKQYLSILTQYDS